MAPVQRPRTMEISSVLKPRWRETTTHKTSTKVKSIRTRDNSLCESYSKENIKASNSCSFCCPGAAVGPLSDAVEFI